MKSNVHEVSARALLAGFWSERPGAHFMAAGPATKYTDFWTPQMWCKSIWTQLKSYLIQLQSY